MVKRKRQKKRRRAPEPVIKVVPSAAIETRISAEVAKADRILRGLTPCNFLESPYLASAIYYHDGLFDAFDENKPTADPADRVVAHIARRLAPATKRAYVALLADACASCYSELDMDRFVVPVPYETPLGSGRGVHPSAIDLFVPEATPVRSASRGLVILAESGWQSGDWFSTSTVRGGNTVIIFNPDTNQFFRYAHLERAQTAAGSFVEAGDCLGFTGHTGFNANRKGHGRHLHFEINAFHGGVTTATPHDDLQALLEAASAKCPGSVRSANPQTAPG